MCTSLDKVQIRTNLLNQIKKVTLSVRAICRCSLVGLVECCDRSVEDADGSLAESKILGRRARIILYTKTPISKCTPRDTETLQGLTGARKMSVFSRSRRLLISFFPMRLGTLLMRG